MPGLRRIAYNGFRGEAPAVANQPLVHLFNAVASTRPVHVVRITVDSASVATATACTFAIGRLDASQVGAGMTYTPMNPSDTRVSSPACSASVGSLNYPAPPSISPVYFREALQLDDTVILEFPPDTIVLVPGTGIGILGLTVGTCDLDASFTVLEDVPL